MNEPIRHVQVVVAFDFSPSSELALARAVEVVARAPQHVLHVVVALEASYEAAGDVQAAVQQRMIAAFAGRETGAEIRFFVHARIGKPAAQILALAEEVGADLLFIGSHGKTGVERFLLGSVSERVVREARCPVLVAREKTYADVDLLQVMRFDHVRAPHREPHCYSYTNQQVLLRPVDWPIG